MKTKPGWVRVSITDKDGRVLELFQATWTGSEAAHRPPRFAMASDLARGVREAIEERYETEE